MAADSASLSASTALIPASWAELLTAHAVKGDMFSARTLMVIHDGVEKLVQARIESPASITINRTHIALFERLQRAFNNPALLKEVGTAYLQEFRLPAIALKHFELAREFAPKDRDLEQLQTAAALAMARQLTDQSGHSGLGEAVHAKPEVSSLIRKTTKLTHIVDAGRHLGESADELGRKQEAWRKTGALKQAAAPNFTEALDRAQNLIAVGDFPAASACLFEARQAGAPVEELKAYYAQLGLTAYNVGQMTEALNAFLHLRDIAPAAIEGWFNCGLVHQKMGKLDDALAAYREAARLAPDNAKIWCNMSSVWFEFGDFNEAEKTARQAIALKPDYARAWDNLASALSSMDRLPEAAEACQQAIHIQPSLHSAWFKFGVIQFQLDHLVKATEAFNLAGDHGDFAAYVLYYMSMIEARRGELDKARYKLTEARASDPRNDLESSALKEIGAAFTKAGRHAIAADFFSQITEKYPDDFSAWLATPAPRCIAPSNSPAPARPISAPRNSSRIAPCPGTTSDCSPPKPATRRNRTAASSARWKSPPTTRRPGTTSPSASRPWAARKRPPMPSPTPSALSPPSPAAAATSPPRSASCGGSTSANAS